MEKLEEKDLYWVAGILEGEGCFKISTTGIRKSDGQRYQHPAVEVNMCDEDIIRRLRQVTGVGNIQGPYSQPKHPNWTPYWRWAVQKKADARDVMEQVLPIMGQRRQARIRAILWP